MNCPKCGGKTGVIDSREPDVDVVFRRRKCKDCEFVFTTKEYEADLIDHMMNPSIPEKIEK